VGDMFMFIWTRVCVCVRNAPRAPLRGGVCTLQILLLLLLLLILLLLLLFYYYYYFDNYVHFLAVQNGYGMNECEQILNVNKAVSCLCVDICVGCIVVATQNNIR